MELRSMYGRAKLGDADSNQDKYNEMMAPSFGPRKKPHTFRKILMYTVLIGAAGFGAAYVTGIIDNEDISKAYSSVASTVKSAYNSIEDVFTGGDKNVRTNNVVSK